MIRIRRKEDWAPPKQVFLKRKEPHSSSYVQSDRSKQANKQATNAVLKDQGYEIPSPPPGCQLWSDFDIFSATMDII